MSNSRLPINKKVILVFVAVILLAVLVPQHQASADLFELDVSSIITGGISWLSKGMLQAMGSIIAWTAEGLEAFVKPETQAIIINTTAVEASWSIIRNIVNLFFILVLIIMAFGTIFDIKNYTWRDMLAKFIIAALLVNFSLAIGQYIVSVSNGLSSVFLSHMSNFSETLAKGLSAEKLIPQAEFPAAAFAQISNESGKLLVNLIFSTVFLVMALLAFLSAFIFAIVRIPALWFLLIISPLAWFSYTLPNLRAKIWSPWWKYFLCWCFFLPYYLFFLMFALIFIAQKGTITASFPPPSGFVSTFTGPGGAFYDVLFYILTLIFMVGGLYAAKKLACASGTYVGKVMGTVESGVRKYAPGAAYVRGGVAGLKERGAEIREKGLLGIGGAQRTRLQEATSKGWIAGAPGPGQIPGAREEASRAMSAEVDKEVKRLQALNLNLDQLNEKLKSSNRPEKFAALKLKAESGWLEAPDADFIAKTVREVGGGRTAVGASMIASLKKGKFHELAASTAEKEAIFNKFVGEDTELAKAFGLDMADNREVVSEILAKQILDLYSTDAKDVRNKVEESIQKNLVNFDKAKTKKDRAAFLQNDKEDKLLRKLLAKQMHEDGEINTYNKYITAAELFGGENETQSRDMFRKIAKEDPITGAEIEFRQTINNSDLTFTPTPAEQAIFASKLSDNMKKVNARQLADADKDSRWKQSWFFDGLKQKVDDLQAKDPAIPAMGKRRAIPGGGERFLQSLKKAVGEDLDKIEVVNKLQKSLIP